MFVDKESGFKVKRYLQNLRWSANIKVLPIIVIAIFLTGCSHSKSMIMKFREIQLTNDAYGHTIHNTQAFSKDDQWIVYDTRNDDTKIAETNKIEMVNVQTGEIKELYATQNQSQFGPRWVPPHFHHSRILFYLFTESEMQIVRILTASREEQA